jgi:hypothetical protein
MSALAMALIALAPWLGGRIALGLGSGRFATAEYTLEPAHEPTGFLFRLGQRLRPALGLRLRWAGLRTAFVPARLAMFAALTGLTRLEWPALASLSGFASVATLAAFPAAFARLATFAALAGRLECPPFVSPWRRTLGGGRRSLRRRR